MPNDEQQRRVTRRPSAPTLRERAYIPDRLRELLAQGLSADVLHVQAPAGSGKTAVVLQFLLDKASEPFWHTCEADDREPANLLKGLVKAMSGEESPGGQTTLAALASRDIRQAYRPALKPFLEEIGRREGRQLV